MEWKRGGWALKLPTVADIEPCQHEEECKFVELENQNNPEIGIKRKRGKRSKSVKKMETSFSGGRAEDISQDTATNMDKSQININLLNISLPSRGSQDQKREEEMDRE